MNQRTPVATRRADRSGALDDPPPAVGRVVALRDAVCVLGAFPALAGADLDVAAGEVLLLAGPNGAGKSTLLRVLAGLLPLRSGHAEVLGVDLAHDRRAHRSRLALVGHATGCYDELTVDENLAFFAAAVRLPREVAIAARDRFALGEVRAVTHSKLSEGQRRRLALAAAFARDPELLLLDEPHAGLDADGRTLLDDAIRDVAARGRTVVFASHELDRARNVASREVRVEGGLVHTAGAPG